jgi:Zn-dependent protease
MGLETIIILAVIVLSIVLHEVSHGYAANWLGDPTARLQGRLTLNPLPHVDPVGSVLVPGLLYLGQTGFMFGWAKPVPYNPYNLTNQRWGEAMVAAAGPAANALLAIIFALIVRAADPLGLTPAFVDLAVTIIYFNVVLCLFNLMPIPPLDGSKVIEPFLPLRLRHQYRRVGERLEHYGLFASLALVAVFIFVLADPFIAVVRSVVGFLVG